MNEVIRYELIRWSGVWKVDAPVPDYPYVGWQYLCGWLSRIANDEQESAERRQTADGAAREISNAATVPDCPTGDIARTGHPVLFPEYNGLAHTAASLCTRKSSATQ